METTIETLLVNKKNVTIKSVQQNQLDVDGEIISVKGTNIKIKVTSEELPREISFGGIVINSHTDNDMFFRDRFGKAYYLKH